MAKYVLHQPDFLPWAGFWQRYAMADWLIVYAGAPFHRQDTMNRVRVEGQWLSLPLKHAALNTPCKEMYLAPGGAEKVLNKLLSYKKGWSQFKRLEPITECLWSFVQRDFHGQEELNLTAFNVELLQQIRMILQLPKRIVVDDYIPKGETTEARLWDLLNRYAAGHYIAGQGGARYMTFAPPGWTTEIVDSSGYPDCSIVELLGKGYFPEGWSNELSFKVV